MRLEEKWLERRQLLCERVGCRVAAQQGRDRPASDLGCLSHVATTLWRQRTKCGEELGRRWRQLEMTGRSCGEGCVGEGARVAPLVRGEHRVVSGPSQSPEGSSKSSVLLE